VGLGEIFWPFEKKWRCEEGRFVILPEVYNNFCVINDLKVQGWDKEFLTDNPHNGRTVHLLRIYSKGTKIGSHGDVAKCIYFLSFRTVTPLSVSDLIA
jgi:hypothetical protein